MRNYLQNFLRNTQLEEENKSLHRTLRNALAENEALKKLKNGPPERQTRDGIFIAGFDSMDSEPTDEKARKDYVSEVDMFFESILGPKLKTVLGEVRADFGRVIPQHELDGLGMTREQYDWYLRGMEGMAWKIHDWCMTLQGERRSMLQDNENQNAN